MVRAWHFLPDGTLAARAKSFEEDMVFFDTVTGKGDIRPALEDEVEAVYRALVLGTRDYVRKCGFRKAVIGLSGGIDSALVAKIAADALGPENVLGVSMPGPYSSESSLTDARDAGAESGNSSSIVLPITDLYFATTAARSKARSRGKPRM